MRVDWTERIDGIRIIEIRNVIRAAGPTLSKAFIVERLGVSNKTALTIIKELLARGFLEVDGKCKSGSNYSVTEKGEQFSWTRAVKRINKAKALSILEDFRKRLDLVNAQHDLIYFVKEVRLFGSFVDPSATDYGDLDVAIDFEVRPQSRRNLIAHCEARSALLGQRLYGWHATQYCRDEVWKLVSARDQYISVTCMDTLKSIKTASELFYIAPSGVDGFLLSEQASAA